MPLEAPPAEPPEGSPGGAGEELLRDAVARELRAPRGRVAVVARLSLMPPPGPLAHHRRIVRTLMQDGAHRHGGQVLQLRSGDLVLLARGGGDADAPKAAAGAMARSATAGASDAHGPHALLPLLARLLQAEGAGGAPVAAVMTLAEAASLLLPAPAAARSTDQARRNDNVPPGPSRPRRLPAPAGILSDGDVAGLLHMQAAARLPAPGTVGRMAPAHRALAIAPHLLAARHLHPAPWLADPWLRQHVAPALDGAMLRLVRAAWGTGTPADAAPRPGVAPLLLPLCLEVVLSAAFAGFARLCRDAGAPVLVAVSVAEACANPQGFAVARARLAAAGLQPVLDRVDPLALALTRPETLGAPLLRMGWNPALLRLPPARHDALVAAIGRIGPGRVVLTGADGEAAIRWGRSAGLMVFEGRHVDAMLAATRLQVCPYASACGLGPCAERATAAHPAGRHGCANPVLLDQATPLATRQAA